MMRFEEPHNFKTSKPFDIKSEILIISDKFLIKEKGQEITEINHIYFIKLYQHKPEAPHPPSQQNQNLCEMRITNPNILPKYDRRWLEI